MGEGGAVYTDDARLATILASLRDWGRDCICRSGQDDRCGHRFGHQYGTLPFGYDHKYVFSEFGYNLKVTEMQAAVGCAQLARLSEFTRSAARASCDPVAPSRAARPPAARPGGDIRQRA